MTIDNDLEILHSEIIEENGEMTVYVQFEKPIDMGFKTARCRIPNYKWSMVENFSVDEINELEEIVRCHAHLFFRYAQTGGVEYA
jgi:hypothetical protein